MQASNDQCIVPPPLDVSSDSVHCNALTQSKTVSYAFSCHTTDTCSEDFDVDLSTPSPSLHQNGPQPSWVQVFSKSSSTSLLRTQCVSGAYLIDKSPEERYDALLQQSPQFFQTAFNKHIANYLGITPVSLSRIIRRKNKSNT